MDTDHVGTTSRTSAVLRQCGRLRLRGGGWLATRIWLLLHLPYVRAQPGARVAASVRLHPFWAGAGRLDLRLGRNSRIHAHVVVQGGGRLTLGARSYISQFAVIGVNERITIGEDVMIASAVSVRDTDHGVADLDRPMRTQGTVTAPVEIGSDVWIGHGATILKGVTIGSGSIVAAGAVVTEDVPARSIVGGVPARVLRRRDAD